MSGGGGGERIIDAGNELGALAIEKIKSAGFHEAFQHLSVGDARIESTTKILQRFKIPVAFALANRHLHCSLADVLDGSQPVPNRLLCRRRFLPVLLSSVGTRRQRFRNKLEPAAIYVRRQDGDSHPFAFRNQHSNFFGVVDFVAEQSSHELDWVVRL